LETYHGPGSEDTHGYDGPLNVSRGTYGCTRAENAFLKAAEKLGWSEIPDLMNLDNNNGIMRQMRFISPSGKRQDVAHGYLHPRLQDGKHPNLHVVVDSKVIRVLFENKKAVGVEYRPNHEVHSDSNVRTVKARKLVILSSGALGNPQILERSGVGDPEVLKKAGVQLVAEVPGVGQDYQDHHCMVYPYKTCLDPEDTIDSILHGKLDPTELIKTNHKMLGWNAMDITAKLRPSDAEAAALGPHFEEVWNREFKSNPNKPLMIISPANW
jgi:alcohol oxidase